MSNASWPIKHTRIAFGGCYKYKHKVHLNATLDCCLLQVTVGDTLDLILNEDKEGDIVVLKRVILKKVVGETKDGEKLKVILRSWKYLRLPRKDVYKDWRPRLKLCLMGERSESGTKVVFPNPLSSHLILRCFLWPAKAFSHQVTWQ